MLNVAMNMLSRSLPLGFFPERKPINHTADAYSVRLAEGEDEIRDAQRLRYRIFADEMGATLNGDNADTGLDHDRFDPFCYHLLVYNAGELIGTTRILTNKRARKAGGFYSQTEFDMRLLLRQPGRYMEIGRTCIHQDHRSGSAISMLWVGIAQFMENHHIDYLMGCASIPVSESGREAEAIMGRLRDKYMAPLPLRVYPKINAPAIATDTASLPKLPPLLKAYLRVGAKICGEPYWDKAFGVADVFIFLPRRELDARYARHFIERPRKLA